MIYESNMPNTTLIMAGNIVQYNHFIGPNTALFHFNGGAAATDIYTGCLRDARAADGGGGEGDGGGGLTRGVGGSSARPTSPDHQNHQNNLFASLSRSIKQKAEENLSKMKSDFQEENPTICLR